MAHSIASERPSTRNAPNVFPASQYLQERLEERRARNTRRRSRPSETGPRPILSRDDDIFVQEADVLSATRSQRSPSTSAYNRNTATPPTRETPGSARSAGAKQQSELFDRQAKQIWNLQIEIDHRRAHQVKLETEVKRLQLIADRAEQALAENAELRKVNAEYEEELFKREKATQEAIDMICDYEERIAELEEDRHSVARASTIHADSGYAGTETIDAASSPEKTRKQKPTPKLSVPVAASNKLHSVLQDAAKARREPSFMKDNDPSTQTLRSVCRGDSVAQLRATKSLRSILSKHTSTIDDDDDASIPNSPHLSNLSEISFTSPTRAQSHPWEPADAPSPIPAHARNGHSRQASITRVSQWIDSADVKHLSKPSSASERTVSPAPTVSLPSQDHFQSLNNALSAVDGGGLAHGVPFRPHTAHDISRKSSRTPTSFGGPIFGEPMLSPTADSASAKLLRASRSTIVDEKSLSDAPAVRFSPLQAFDQDLRTTPKQMRSSLELKDAFNSNLEYRKTGLRQMQHVNGSPTSEDDLDFPYVYHGYPDGGSILSGTPSRFKNVPRKDATPSIPYRPASRRKSSSAATADTRKPDLIRAGTSPNMLPSLMTVGLGNRPKTPSHNDAMSPISYHSNSSGQQTAYGATEPRVPPSPARTLTQKTQSLFRRLSGSHGSDRPRQISPSPSRPVLPTLTSTPSSAYINIIPKEQRRIGGSVDATNRQLPASAAIGSTQSPTPARTRSGSDARHGVPMPDSTEKRGFFGRRGSFRQAAPLERSKTVAVPTRGRRRSSVREAIISGKRWP